MNEYRILFGFGGRAKLLTVDSEEQLELKVLFNIGSKILFDKASSQNIEGFKALLAESIFVYFYIVKRKADGSLDSLSLSEIRSLTKDMILEDSPFVKFCRVSPRGHAARHEQAKFLSSLLNFTE